MAIKIGGNDVKNLMVGDKQVERAYLGISLVWQNFNGVIIAAECVITGTNPGFRLNTIPSESAENWKTIWIVESGTEREIWNDGLDQPLNLDSDGKLTQKKYGIKRRFSYLDTGGLVPRGDYTLKIEYK